MSSVTNPPGRAGYIHDMTVVESIHRALKEAGIDFATHLSETNLRPVMAAIDGDPDITTVSVTREDEGVAINAGAFLGGKWPVLLTEASGIGLSGLILARAIVQRTPMLILASHNLALGEKHDYTAAARPRSTTWICPTSCRWHLERHCRYPPSASTCHRRRRVAHGSPGLAAHCRSLHAGEPHHSDGE